MINFGIAFFAGHFIMALYLKSFRFTPYFAIFSGSIILIGILQ